MNPKYPTIFDNTMRCQFLECPRKLNWWWQGYDYEQIPPYFAFGQAWGIIKQAWYTSKGHKTDPKSPEWQALALDALAQGIHHWEDLGTENAAKPNDLETLAALWNSYLEIYPNEDLEMIAPEVGFTFPLGVINGQEVNIGGALDGYVSQEGLGVYALEEKTVGIYLSDSYISSYTYSPQITTYIWQGRKTIGGEFSGVLVNMATKRILGPSAKTPQFARTFQNRTDEELEEFERDFSSFIKDYYRAIDEDYFRKSANPINCAGGIGKSPCLFRGLCASGIPYKDIDPLAFPFIIKKEDWIWEPWKRGQEDEKKNSN